MRRNFIMPSVNFKKIPKIYTKTGDKGTSSLYTGERRTKNDPIFIALGTVDELSCHIGASICSILGSEDISKLSLLNSQLHDVQCILQDIGGIVATPEVSARPNHLSYTSIDLKSEVKRLEIQIDAMTDDLPPLTQFILPGGSSPVSTSIHLARAVCRRAERCLVDINSDERTAEVAIFLNRLSDFLFTAARYSLFITGHNERFY